MRNQIFNRSILILVGLLLVPTLVFSHPGRTDANGGHVNRKTGEYHTHGSKRAPAANNSQQVQGQKVYVTNTGKKYHRDGCVHLKSRIPMSLVEAKARYTPCKVCNPPS